MTFDLARRAAFTIGALFIFLLGNHIPIAGTSALSSGPFSFGAAARVSIFALAIVPYLSAALIIQLLSMVSRRLSSLARSGEAGRRAIARYTLTLTLPLAGFQAFGVASGLQGVPGLVADPDGWFRLSATVSMVGGVFFLVWLCEQMTRHGVGNGLALVLSVSILVSLPGNVASTMDLVRRGELSERVVLFHALFGLAMVALIVFIETARRNVAIEFAARKVGERLLPAQPSTLPIKLNSAGFLVLVTLQSWVLFLPLIVAGLLFGGATPWIAVAFDHMKLGQPAHLVLGSIAIFVLAFIYTSYVLDPERAAEQLHKRGGVIPGVEPGEPTAAYLDRVVTLTTVIGAVYLTALSLIPEALMAYGAVPYYISGGAALIVVCTFLDLKTQVRDVSLTNPGGGRR